MTVGACGGSGRERGAVLVFVLLIMLALSLLVHGALVESLSELTASNAAVRQLRAVTASRSAVQRALDGAGGAWMDSVPRGAARAGDTLRAGALSSAASLRRLDAEVWLVEGAAWLGSVEVARSGRLAWSLDPLARVSALEGAVSVGTGAPVVADGPIDVGAPVAVEPPMEPDACDPWLDSLRARYVAAPLAAVATLPTGSGPPALGLLDLSALLEAAPYAVGDVGTPEPLEAGGACVAGDPWNWGDPDRPWRPCGDFFAFRASPADLAVEGGSGQGVLVVDGTLTLSAGARLRGLVVTSGALRLDGGARLEGLALAAGGVQVASDAALVGSACWAVRALSAQRDILRRLVPLPGTGWIGPL